MASDAPTTSPAHEADTGEVRIVASKYRLCRAIGHGGMGVVYEAENTWTSRRVALKVLDPGRMADPVQVQRFMQEARAAAALHHPNVVDVLDMGQDPVDGSLFIVHELLVGEDLRSLLAREKRLDVDRTLALMTPALRGLAAAHAAGIVHRDVKPANLFLARGVDGETVPKVIDFGIAKDLARDASQARTDTGETVGTPAYMAPEQLRGERTMAPAADVWAVGVVLHEMLGGSLPFPSDNYNVLVHRVLAGERPPLDVTLSHIPAALRRVIARCLDPDPACRYESASALLEALADDRASTTPMEVVAPERPRNRLAAAVLMAVAASVCASTVIALSMHRPLAPAPHGVTRRHEALAPPPERTADSDATTAAAPDATPSEPMEPPSAPLVAAPVDARDASVEHLHGAHGHGHHAHVEAPVAPAAPSTPDASPLRARPRAILLSPGGAYPSQ